MTQDQINYVEDEFLKLLAIEAFKKIKKRQFEFSIREYMTSEISYHGIIVTEEELAQTIGWFKLVDEGIVVC